MDRRLYTRMTLRHPIPCSCQIGQEEPLDAQVVNVSIMGIMLEVPGLKDRLTIECCQRAVVQEDAQENGHLFSGINGTLNWVYKSYVGIGFDHPIKSSNMELRTWLGENGQLCEEAS